MKLRIQTLTGQSKKVKVDQEITILDLKVCVLDYMIYIKEFSDPNVFYRLSLKLIVSSNVDYASEIPFQWRIQDFHEVGTPTLLGATNIILPNFPKNCMKLKEFGPGGVEVCVPPLDPPLI